MDAAHVGRKLESDGVGAGVSYNLVGAKVFLESFFEGCVVLINFTRRKALDLIGNSGAGMRC